MKKEILRLWIVHPMNPAPASMGQKLEEVGERYSRNDFIPQESSWPITREEKNVRPTVNREESRPEIGEAFRSYFFFLLLLSIERVFVPPFLSSPRTIRRNRPPSKRNKLNLAGFQRSWRNSSNRPTIFIARPNLLAPTWIARIFFF